MKYAHNFFRAFGSFFRTTLDYYGLLRSKHPLFISWDISSECNANCVFCNRSRKKSKSFSLKKKLSLISKMDSLGLWMLSLCGGEPLLMKGFEEVVKATKKTKMLLNISTNGFFLPEKADFLIENKVDYITVSIDSDSPEEHDKARGVEGIFNKAISGLDYIIKNRKGKRPFLSIRCIVNKNNITRMGKIIEVLEKHCDEVLLQPIHLSPEIGYVPPPSMLFDDVISEDELNEIKSRFRMDLLNHNMASSYNLSIPDFIFLKDIIVPRCYSGFYFLEIDQEGILWNCPEHKLRIADLGSDNLSFVLNSPNFSKGILDFFNSRKCNCMHSCVVINKILDRILF